MGNQAWHFETKTKKGKKRHHVFDTKKDWEKGMKKYKKSLTPRFKNLL